jgi:hypothetical protein
MFPMLAYMNYVSQALGWFIDYFLAKEALATHFWSNF